ncbi:MAG: hypothetical protein ACTSU9_05875 [Promethearchaeota archaeon]
MVGCLPIMYLNTLSPRLAIVTGDVSLDFADLTVFDFTELSWEGNITDKYMDVSNPTFEINSSATYVVSPDEYAQYSIGTYVYKYEGMGAPMATTVLDNNMTLDFWLEVGLPIKDDTLAYSNDSGSWDLRYYNMDGTVNVSNLQDPDAQMIIPRIGLKATFRGNLVGVGGTNMQYVLNRLQPIQYVHMYLEGSREPEGGLMSLFTTITEEGALDALLLSAIGGGSGLDMGSLLGDLKLEITAYIGSAPLTLSLDTSLFGLNTLPIIDISGSGIIEPDQDPIPIWHYNFSNVVDSMDRFTSQLGIDDVEPLLEDLGLMYYDTDNEEWVYEVNTIQAAVNQIFDENITSVNNYTVNMETYDKWWIDGSDLTVDMCYNETYFEPIISNRIQEIKVDFDYNNTLPIANVTQLMTDDDYQGLYNLVENWWAPQYSGDANYTQLIGNVTELFTSLNFTRLNSSDEVDVDVWGQFPDLCLTSLISKAPVESSIYNAAWGTNITVAYESDIVNIFNIMAIEGYSLKDLFNALDKTIPEVLTAILFGTHPSTPELFGQPYSQDPVDDSITPQLAGSIDSTSLVLLISMMSFIALFFIFSITKGSVRINRREFLSREDIQRNISHFNKQVESLGGKVSMQNSESLVIRSFKSQGKIEKVTDVEKRAKQYVENQKLLVTLQSRASRAYVAQKFKDCISAIEKMIEIARKLEDQTLVTNYEENLAKVVKLLRRKGISVRTKIRTEEQKPEEELENLKMYKKDLVDLQNQASKLFAEKNWSGAKDCIKEMLAIAKKIQDPVLIRNYEANLRKIIQMEKGGM